MKSLTPFDISKRFIGIFPRAVLFSLSIVALVMGIFAFTIAKREERLLLDHLASRAQLLAASVDRVSAYAIVAEEQWTVVEQFQKMVDISPEVRYAVVTKQADGSSLVFTKGAWRVDELDDEFWRPSRDRTASTFLHQSEEVGEEVLHYSYPFSYEGYNWGWIHVGMSLSEYRTALAGVYRITGMLAIAGMVLGFVLSFFFARRLTRPIAILQTFASRLASGDLDHRVTVRTQDEVGDLAESLNSMAEKLAVSLKRENELREKDVLLKEIHHRVKNNMQILTSLLRLQSRRLENPEIRTIMKESESRIRSMGLIHEKLYQSNSLSEIEFESYARTLTGELQRMYGGAHPGIQVLLDAKGVELGLDTALPCGLIVNELVSNSFKYGFPEGRTGEIRIRMRPLGDGDFELIVSDNGIGIPEGEKLEREGSLGMRLVSTLVQQINGELQTSNGVGITTTIQFRESQYKQRL